MKRFNPCIVPVSEPANPSPPEPAETVPVRDFRRELEETQTRKEILFTKYYGQPDAPKVIVPFGMMAVHLSVKFDNSDIQTDYFDRHASLSPDFVLLVVKKQAETERLGRKALALCPELAGLEWEWHSEKWSMGHGSYLESSGFELPEELKNLQNGYRSGGITHGHWEIEFSRSGGDLKLLPHKNFGQSVAQPVSKLAVTMTINAGKQGIELRFPEIPSETVRTELKAAGWRWSRFGGCWYVKDTPEKRQWAEIFVTRNKSTTETARVEPPQTMAVPLPQPPAIQLPGWRQRFYPH